MIGKAALPWVVVAIVFLGAVGFFLSQSILAPEEEENPYRVKVGTGWFAGSPSGAILYVAQERGYFAQQGLEVELFPNPPGSPGAAELVGTGLLDFAEDGQSETLAAIVNGLPVRAIGTLFQVTPYAIYSLADNCLRTPEDLVGKKVGLISGSEGELILPGMLKRVLGEEKFKQITFVSTGFSPEPLLARQVDAQSSFVPSAPLNLELEGYEICVILAKDYGVKFGGNVILTRTKMIEERPEVVEMFMKAIARAAVDVVDESQVEEIVEICEKYRSPDYASLEYVRRSLPLYNSFAIIPTPGRSGLLWNNPESWSEAQDLMLQGERISRRVPLESLFTNEFLEKIYSAEGRLVWP